MAYEFYLGKTFTFHLFLCKMNIEDYMRKDKVMRKQIVSSIILIMLALMLGLTGRVLATNQEVTDDDGTVQNYVENTNRGESNMQQQGVNTAPTDYVNDISNKLQNMASEQQPKDMRRQVTVMVIVIITVLLIVGLITWYYMTNQ